MNPCPLPPDYDATPRTVICPTCQHPLGSHLYPEGLCISCVNQENVIMTQRLGLHIDLQERMDQLAQGHVFLVERLERLENHVAIRGTALSRMSDGYPGGEAT